MREWTVGEGSHDAKLLLWVRSAAALWSASEVLLTLADRATEARCQKLNRPCTDH
jgi:hypothetical protein